MDEHRRSTGSTGSALPRRLATLAVLLLVGCDAVPTPVLGGAGSVRSLNAARMAFEDLAPEGALDVDTLFFEETSNRSEPALRTAERFAATEGVVAVVGHSNSAASIAASQIYNGAGIAQIAPHSSADLYSEAGPWSFRLVPPDTRQASFLASAVDSLFPDGARLALLWVNDAYGRGLHAELLRALDLERHDLVVDLPHTEEDVGTPVAIDVRRRELVESAPDGILWLARGTTLVTYLPILREAAAGARILASDAVSAVAVQNWEKEAWQGLAFVDFVDLRSTSGLRLFAERYEERTGLPATGPDALAYDAMGMLLTAMREGSGSAAEIRGWLEALGRERPPYDGLTGPVTFDERGDVERGHVLRVVGPRGGS